ncbi:ankyrin [Lophium mytilinum]|uniref:Ankyrin n=1 Tax=Lophium mytilinum TaxID=390894 RepID=A0A6A6QTT4_9PEZI|nr:ankyrin [Lophium mytilinum]
MIDVPRRLRRAILLNDLALVKRIVRNNPTFLRNPDFEDKSNTSLHLAAKQGFKEIAEFLISTGHEAEGVSRNGDWDTPLMLAASAGRADVGVLLVERFPECVSWENKEGMDALMLASRTGTLPLLPPLLHTSPTIISHHDASGNTALHHASAAGELKALRMLLTYGANPLAQNAYSWTPVHYSATQAAEVYFKNLVGEFERQRVEIGREKRERERQRMGGVRLVTNEDAMAGMRGGRASLDDGEVLKPPSVEWSPVESRRAMTPTARSEGWFGGNGGRARASSGD